MTDTSSTYSYAFYGGVLVFTGFAAGVFVYNAVEWNNVRKFVEASVITPQPLQPAVVATVVLVNESTANTLYWLNVILAIFAILIFIWALIAMLFLAKTSPTLVYHTPGTVNHIPQTGSVKQTTTTFMPNRQGVQYVPTSANLVTPGTAQQVAYATRV